MFNNSKSNNKDNKSVNTRGLQFKNKESKSPSTMMVGFWDDRLTVKICPALPKEKQTTDNVYDYDHGLNMILVPEKVEALVNIIKDDIMPAMEEGKNLAKGVTVSSNSVIMVGTGVAATDEVSPYIAIFKDIDENLVPGQAIRYFFKNVDVIEGYDGEEDKSFSKTENKGQFLLFVRCLEKAAEEFSNATSHSIRTVDKFFRDRQMDTLNQMAVKAGVDVGFRPSASKGLGAGNVFDFQQPTQPTLADLPDAQFEESDDLPF